LGDPVPGIREKLRASSSLTRLRRSLVDLPIGLTGQVIDLINLIASFVNLRFKLSL